MPKQPRFVLRTIQDGTVKIFGDTYRPDLDASRFNGMRAAFGLILHRRRTGPRIRCVVGKRRSLQKPR